MHFPANRTRLLQQQRAGKRLGGSSCQSSGRCTGGGWNASQFTALSPHPPRQHQPTAPYAAQLRQPLGQQLPQRRTESCVRCSATVTRRPQAAKALVAMAEEGWEKASAVFSGRASSRSFDAFVHSPRQAAGRLIQAGSDCPLPPLFSSDLQGSSGAGGFGGVACLGGGLCSPAGTSAYSCMPSRCSQKRCLVSGSAACENSCTGKRVGLSIIKTPSSVYHFHRGTRFF